MTEDQEGTVADAAFDSLADVRPGDRFLIEASRCLWDVPGDGLPYALEEADAIRLTSRRLLEAGAELCDAMDTLQRDSLHRPAHALLRALLETMSYVVWIFP